MARTGENIYKRKDGRWEARYIDSYSAEGKAKYRSIYGKSRKEVKEKRLLIMHQKFLGIETSVSSAMRFYDLAQNWLNSTKLRVKESTFARYNNQVSKYILPYFGKYQLSKISTERIECFINCLMESRKNGGFGLSPKTAEDILILIKNMLKFGKCPAHLDLYRIKIKKTTSKPRTLSKIEQIKLHQHLQNHIDSVHLGILLSLHTGIRIGELCALCWKDIRLDEQTIHVEKTLQRIQENYDSKNKTKIIITPPKTKKSIRSIPIPNFLLEPLHQMRRNAEDFLLSGSSAPMEPRTLQNRFKKCLQKCGVSDYNFHSLRHTFATNYIETGFDARSLSQLLGHANVKTTLELYVHSSEELKRANIEKLIETAYSPSNLPSLQCMSPHC